MKKIKKNNPKETWLYIDASTMRFFRINKKTFEVQGSIDGSSWVDDKAHTHFVENRDILEELSGTIKKLLAK